jgi:hypothetical protein
VLTTLFLGASLIAPPPFPPFDGGAYLDGNHDPGLLTLIVTADWNNVPKGQEMHLRWNPYAPPGVLLVECEMRATPPGAKWSGPNQGTRDRATPPRTQFPFDLREAVFRDAYGRVLYTARVHNSSAPSRPRRNR